MSTPAASDRATPSLALILGVLGVVYGDIGTSPLYAMRAAASHFEDGGVEAWEVLGLLSLIIWSLILTVTVKYVAFVLRADNRGEGGILALMALAQRSVESPRLRWALALIGIAGACLFFGDGIITPAISVLSAVEGLKVVSPHLEKAVLPISVVILVALFLVQYRGTAKMGAVFGPICAAWFLVLGLLGLWEVLHNPGVLAAISPHWAITFCLHYKFAAFIAFGSVVLAVTGAEALYADMGHFGRRPIRWAWMVIVLPALVLNYLGQGALLLRDPAALENPFFLLAPEWFRLPLVFLATAATIIASQAMISGAYTIARQCVQLGFMPRLVVRHTSDTEEGQIYMPQVNIALLIGVLILVMTATAWALRRNGENWRAAGRPGFAPAHLALALLPVVAGITVFLSELDNVMRAVLPGFLLEQLDFAPDLDALVNTSWQGPVLAVVTLTTGMVTSNLVAWGCFGSKVRLPVTLPNMPV